MRERFERLKEELDQLLEWQMADTLDACSDKELAKWREEIRELQDRLTCLHIQVTSFHKRRVLNKFRAQSQTFKRHIENTGEI